MVPAIPAWPSTSLNLGTAQGIWTGQEVKVGYARVSTDEQNLSLQIDALHKAGCDQLYTDQGISGRDFSRPGLDRALAALAPGDALVVWRLDRLGRSLAKLIDLVTFLGTKQVQFVSLTEAINTDSPGGRLIFHMMGALAEFERALISERTRAGLAAARARGKQLGRQPSLSPAQRIKALDLLARVSAVDAAKEFNVHPRTLTRLLRKSQQQNNSAVADA